MTHRPSLLAGLALALALLLLPLRSLATTVIPPDFDSLVAQSDYVVRAVVKSVSSEWRVDGQNRNIITQVVLDVKEVIAGTPPQPLVLEFLGGTVGDRTLQVDGAPKFYVGEEDILFVHGNGRQFVPLVALMHGQYPVLRDEKTGQASVLRANGMPLYSEQDVSLPMSTVGPTKARQASAKPLTPAEFASKIRASRQNSSHAKQN
jgi:hypothetical protein